ncbi:4'-phosphopantetheinyl transferase superfamily protein [uncultured Bacteroides sp.]|uniref:4'-phosphopantetheinyl transferase family protein n=1 Tax=uncultured Bacteroides sp. TaxID=162156 RepID=UPI0025E7AEB0|nr:4'-phosphopantetheinyl transferase superfamily protein [uncultured Bacteroides sp.]
MALFLEHREGNIQWAVWKMEESLEALLLLLPDVQRITRSQEIQRFTSERRKMEWLSVRVLLYSMLQEDKEISYSTEGKPYLADNSSFISISHTKGYVAVILGSVAPVGIDIEQYGQRVHRVSDRYIRQDEQVEPSRNLNWNKAKGDMGDITWSLLLHWSAKEAIYKRMEDADADLRKLRLSHFIPENEGTFQVQEFVTESQKVYSVGYCIYPDFVLTWTVD